MGSQKYIALDTSGHYCDPEIRANSKALSYSMKTFLSLSRTALYTLAVGLSLLILAIGWAEIMCSPSANSAGLMMLFFFFAVMAACGISALAMTVESALWKMEHREAMARLYPAL